MKPLSLLILLLLVGCFAVEVTPQTSLTTPKRTTTEVIPHTSLRLQTETPVLISTKSAETKAALPTYTLVPTDTPNPADWENWPVVPAEISERMLEIYKAGLERGRDPRRFSKVGDCQNTESLFFTNLDYNHLYTLPSNMQYLEETLDWYGGSFKRVSYAVNGGLNAAAAMSSLWLKPECAGYQHSVECEIQEYNPSIVIVSFEENWDGNVAKYTTYTTAAVEYALSQKVIPILVMSSNNRTLNESLALIAVEHEVPVWNLWAAIQPLKDNGLADGGFYLSHGSNYNFESGPQSGLAAKNLTGLQTLDSIRRLLQQVSR